MTEGNRYFISGKKKERIERLKWEIAEEHGLDEKIQSQGWEGLSTGELGKIAGEMVKRLIKEADNNSESR